MTDDIKQAYDKCIQAFIQENYAECVVEAMPLLKTWTTPVLGQMLVISLQRTGKVELADQLGSVFATDSALDPWSKELMKLTLMKSFSAETLMDESKKLLERAQDNKQRCQLAYYLGAKFVTLGVREYARTFFPTCKPRLLDELQATMMRFAQPSFVVAAAIDVPCLEQTLALSYAAKLPKKPWWKFGR